MTRLVIFTVLSAFITNNNNIIVIIISITIFNIIFIIVLETLAR